MSNLKSKWWPSYGFEKNMDCFPEISISYLSFSLNTFPLFSDGWDYQRDLFLYSYCWLTNKSPHCTKYGQNIKAWECVENFSSWISDIPSPGDSVEMLCCVMLHYSDIILWSCRPVIFVERYRQDLIWGSNPANAIDYDGNLLVLGCTEQMFSLGLAMFQWPQLSQNDVLYDQVGGEGPALL